MDEMDDETSTTQLQQSGVPPSKRKRETVSAACERCRYRKIKCDGRRPRCLKCTSARTACVYTVHDGQTRQDATKARYEKLEEDFTSMRNILDRLRNCSIAEADQILERMRKCDDPVTFAQSVSGNMADSSAHGLLAKKDMADFTSSNASSTQSDRDTPDNMADGQFKVRAAYTNPECATDNAMLPSGLYTEMLGSLRIPDERSFREAVDAFHECSGMLFHICDRDMIEASYDWVFRPQGQSPNSTALCRLSSMAAVGSLYKDSHKNNSLKDDFYNIARLLLDSCIESDPLGALTYCAMVAMYNVLSRATVALVYVELGMSLSRQHRVHLTNRPSTISEKEWFQCKRAWRALVFFGAWISSTYGRHSGNEWDLPPDTDVSGLEGAADMRDMMQIQLVKIAVLKRNILRVNITDPQITVFTVDTVSADLHQWYESLPPQMSLSTLLEGSDASYLHGQLRRTVYFVHLLYLGSLMLLYRRIAMQATHHAGNNQLDESIQASLEKLDDESALAAEQTARILSLLADEEGIFERCWIVIFQAYSAGTLLLRKICQHGEQTRCPNAQVSETLARVEKCLNVLSRCSKSDPVARKFEQSLRHYYNSLSFLSKKPSNTSSKFRKTELELYQLVLLPFDHITQNDLAGARASDAGMALHSHLDWADSYRMDSSWDRAAAGTGESSPPPPEYVSSLDRHVGLSVESMVRSFRPTRAAGEFL